ncbi:MAG TPA: ATP-binding cassette domain-containing protein [Baekduia sp.]|uniref:ATP-binding cassette domain-containing protein n=1 Tax=Baekduia sp. TaxID=2600305 RepID=UPI002CF8EB68|nr:ATP-binding cassette domain-containing protein [Baekduia sp.]HMJ34992.1 ATP-binding cassette domain-containing protein [Baekduia sp.]
MTLVLSLDSVEVCYWRGQRPVQVLRDASMDVHAGEVAGVWAKARGGKTTLLELAAGVLAPDRGRVLIDGRDLADLTTRQTSELLHRAVGLATRAGPAVPDLPVAAWVALGLIRHVDRRAAEQRARQALERVGVGAVAGEPWRNLSDSERILAAIARAVVCQPRLLLIDDPTAGLDMIERGELLDLLRSIAATTGVAVLMSASDMADLQGVETVWSLVDGHLLGPPREAATVLDFARRAKQG